MCVCARARVRARCVRLRCVCVAQSCVRRARHVIQRNPPPETRGSEGDSIGYKASANICPEQCKADENISSELTQDLFDFFYFPWIYHLALPSRCNQGDASLLCTLSECDSTTNSILELTSNHRYSGLVRFLLTFCCEYNNIITGIS